MGLGEFKELQQLDIYKEFKQILKVVGLWNYFQLFSLNFLKFAHLHLHSKVFLALFPTTALELSRFSSITVFH